MSATPSDLKFPFLVSYAYLREKDEREIEWILSNPKIEVLLDSGAFTALNAGDEILLDEYMNFLRRWGSRLFGYIALDKLGDPSTTDRNLRVMLDAGLRPIPVHVRGDDGARMDELFTLSEWVALGGFRRPHRGPARPEYIKQKMEWARGRNVHWLGYTNFEMVKMFTPFSCDCSSWSAGVRYGEIGFSSNGVWHQRWNSRTALTRAPELYVIEALEMTGLTMDEFRTPSLWRRNVAGGVPLTKHVPLQLNAFSWVKHIMFIRRQIGTRLFLACRLADGEAETLFKCINACLGGAPYPLSPA